MVPLDKFVDRVLASGVLMKSMVELPPPASRAEIDAAEARLGSALPESLMLLYKRWNGAILDVVRFVACSGLEVREEGLYFANDPSGFMYFLDRSGAVVQLDTDGGSIKTVASDVHDFLAGWIFGSRAEDFAGSDWAADIRAAGLAT